MRITLTAALSLGALPLLVHGQLVWSDTDSFKDGVAALPAPRPVVFYHGMGDTAHSEGMEELFRSVRVFAPSIYIHSIQLAESESDDKKAGFFGNVNNQIDAVCKQLKEDPKLKGGFNAVGFSQGGQFLRAYVQRCNDPPVHNLITFGSQHSGVSDIPGCVNSDPSCRLMRSIVKAGVYSAYVQNRVVQAQYYKDPRNIPRYLESCLFLPYLNNELEVKNATYAENLKKLNALVMILFEQDITVKPKETSWFGFEDSDGNILELEDQDIYREDWIGLKAMDDQDKLVYLTLPGQHMQFSLDEFAEKVTIPYLLELDQPGQTTKSQSLANRMRIKQMREQEQQHDNQSHRGKDVRFKLQILDEGM
ncbi:hypothetical protein BGZ73_004722 [Actinomortierella ambigua]|nr:hypothetical protein BGZ73_004722 [Actinomortierella ambigua]